MFIMLVMCDVCCVLVCWLLHEARLHTHNRTRTSLITVLPVATRALLPTVACLLVRDPASFEELRGCDFQATKELLYYS
jgi:hypothetical protein